MLVYLADISIRSLLLAIPAAIVLWILRSRRTAALQHAVWTAVVCGMLGLFAFGQMLPRLPLRILDDRGAAVSSTPTAVFEDRPGALSVGMPQPQTAIPPRIAIGWRDVVAYTYGAIAFALLVHFATGMWLARRLLASARAIPDAGGDHVYESEIITVPATVGWLRPRTLLPLEWREWDAEKLAVVIAHEGAHRGRRDGLVAALAGINRCIFWFHPLAWILQRKLALLAEQACDDACVAGLGNREQYAHLLLEMAGVVDDRSDACAITH